MLEENHAYKTEEFIPYSNPDKRLEIMVGEKRYIRHAIKTHFVEAGKEDYIDIIRRYVLPIYKPGDVVSVSEKIIALCQNRIITKDQIKVGFWAKFLTKFVYKSPYGYGLKNPDKMAAAIKIAGLPKVLFAAFCSMVGKIFGVRGLFYKMVGHNVANIDGFNNLAFEYYGDKGMISPENPGGVCDEIKEKLQIDCMIVDANDVGVEILGISKDMPHSPKELEGMVKDNPAGQDDELTPIILIREASKFEVQESL